MAIITNTALTFGAVGNREDLADTIYNIDPVETPFLAAIGKTKAEAVLHEWQTDNLAAAGANAAIEGDDTTVTYTFGTSPQPTRLGNRCQITRKDAVVSGTQDAVNKAGRRKEIAYQLAKKNKEIRRDMEFIALSNQAPVTGTATTPRQLRPVCGWYATNTSRGAGGANGSASASATDGTQRALTEALMKGVIAQTWQNGGDIDLILAGRFNKMVISGFTGGQTRQVETDDGKLTTAIDIYESDFGAHQIKADRFQRDRDLHLLMTEMWAVSYLRPMQTIDLAKTGDNEKGLMLAEWTLECRNEAGSGIVADLTTA